MHKDYSTFQFTEVTAYGGTPMKRLTWCVGQVVAEPPRVPTRGEFVRREMTLPDFADWLRGDRCLTLGVTQHGRIGICTKRNPQPGCIARTKENFDWPEGLRLVLLDVDDTCGQDDSRDNVVGLCRDLGGDVDLVVAPSSSSGLSVDGKPVGGGRKWHLYALLNGAVEDFRKYLETKLAAEGLAFVKVSKSGAVLRRHFFDLCVLDPCRVIFEATPELSGGLERQAEPVTFLEGSARFIDVGDLTTTPDDEARAEAFWRDEESRKRAESEDRAAVFDVGRAVEERLGRSLRENEGKRLLGGDTPMLPRDLALTFDDGSRVVVGDLWLFGERFDGAPLAHPLEPERNGGRNAAVFYWNEGKNPLIVCLAHGGERFLIEKEPLFMEAGSLHASVAEARETLEKLGVFFCRSGELVRIVSSGGQPRLKPIDRHELRVVLSRCRRILKQGAKGGWRPTEPPDSLVHGILSEPEAFPYLRGICPVPVLNRGGELARNGLIGDVWVDAPKVQCEISFEAATRAVACLKSKVLAGFEFSSAVDESAALSLLLTIACRGQFMVAPMFGIDAPRPGSGKTYLAEIASALAGCPFMPVGWPKREEEQVKSLAAVLREGATFVGLDNVDVSLGGDHLNVVCSAGRLKSRKLGVSAMIDLDASLTTLVATGNGLTARADQNRRMCWVRLEPATDSPETRRFSGSPLDYVKRLRANVLMCCWEIALFGRSLQAGGLGTSGLGPAVAGFEDWSAWCRLPLMALGLPDPLGNRSAYEALDPVGAVEDEVVLRIHERLSNREKLEPASTTAKGLISLGIDFSGAIYGEVTPRRVGRLLAKLRGRRVVVDGKTLVLRGDTYTRSKNATRWFVEVVEGG